MIGILLIQSMRHYEATASLPQQTKPVPGQTIAPMTQRILHLACYDVSEPRRLIAALKLARVYATGGQKSVHELFLTPAERINLVDDMSTLLDLSTDRFLLLRLDPRSRVHTLGKAVKPADPDYFYVG
jgi:CRISPR-associated protein Cas2